MSGLSLDLNRGYFRNEGVNVIAFDDIYPEGHQSGVSVLMHGRRIATCGDVRFEPTPGQWQPVPGQVSRKLDAQRNAIITRLRFPDEKKSLRGTNPMVYPDLELSYQVTVRGEGDAAVIEVDLDEPVPEAFAGRVCFNLELYPAMLFGKPWMMDDRFGVFPRQPNGPIRRQPSIISRSGHQASHPSSGFLAERNRLADGSHGYNPIIADDLIAEPYAEGKCLTVCPDDPQTRLRVECLSDTTLQLCDGRMNHNNGWFVVSSVLPAGATRGALCWRITPNAVRGWRSPAAIQVSQVGYHPGQAKKAVLELDPEAEMPETAELYCMTDQGEKCLSAYPVKSWGNFLRYRYGHVDFSGVTQPGLYRLRCADAESTLFRISEDVYDRGVWQPVLEYFLPVQMCHMRVQEKYRVWHGRCHMDDARMAPVGFNHFDGYVQPDSTLTHYQPGDAVPGLNAGGWHDAGDYDLRVESQAGEVYTLALAYEAFQVDYDTTTIDQAKKLVEIHQPDGRNDLLQQIEHGMLFVVGSWNALGRLCRGIICNSLRQYVLLGDAAAMTDGVPGNEDDRWVFTEENPARELSVAAQLAAGAHALSELNPGLAEQGLQAAETIFDVTVFPEDDDRSRCAKIHAAVELYLSTRGEKYSSWLLNEADYIAQHMEQTGWMAARVLDALQDEAFTAKIRSTLPGLKQKLEEQCAETPYGIPYRPYIWGAGWGIQRMALQYYFLHQAFPEVFERAPLENALNFVLGCHPGSNTASFASGIGTKSSTIAYGVNRADWSYIPGGVVSGTALIRPDFPELLEYPFLWQQTEYVLGGGSSNFMFMVLAVQSLLKKIAE